jgi:hypothetical protein
MKRMKVFDCQDMPEDLRTEFFEDEREGHGRGNDVFISWYINYSTDPSPAQIAINKWLIENGAKDDEEVLIRHWW